MTSHDWLIAFRGNLLISVLKYEYYSVVLWSFRSSKMKTRLFTLVSIYEFKLFKWGLLIRKGEVPFSSDQPIIKILFNKKYLYLEEWRDHLRNWKLYLTLNNRIVIEIVLQLKSLLMRWSLWRKGKLSDFKTW